MQTMSSQANKPTLNTRTTIVIVTHLAISSLLLLLSCKVVTGEQSSHKPLISPLAKDPNTSLYTILIKDGKAPLVVDLAGSLVWSTCPSAHTTIPCQSATCSAAIQQNPRRCRYVEGGRFWANRQPAWQCTCTGHPLNPVSGECSTGDLTSFAMSANTTNGTNLLSPESFTAVGACAPDRLLKSLPAGSAGVAGFSRHPLSLPSQLAAQRGFGDRFALCLPVFAAFGDTPVYLGTESRGLLEYTGSIPYTPLLANPRNAGGYYIPVTGISVSWGADVPAALPGGALELDVRAGRGGVVLSTATPYTIMRPDVFRAFAQAFDDAIARGKNQMNLHVERVPAVKPFELCYSGGFPMLKRPVSFDAPRINLELAGATSNWTLFNNNYLVQLERALCVGILEMGPGGMPVDGEPAVVIGAKQLENNLLVFDREKMVLGFSMLLDFHLTSCYSTNMFRL